ELAVEHLNANGTVDLGFGQNGVVHQDFGLFDFNVTGLELALQTDGKLVVGGSAYPSDLVTIRPYIARLNPDGSLDSTFFNAGVGVQGLFVGSTTQLHRIALDSHGRIVAAGETNAPQSTNPEFGVSVLHPDGMLDSSFDLDGRVQEDFFGPGSVARAVVPVPEAAADPILAIGDWVPPQLPVAPTHQDFAVVKYLANGQRDPNYGTLGRTWFD